MLSLDGGHTLNEVAARIGMPASVVGAICGALSEASLIHKAEVGDRPVPHEEFAEVSRRVFAAWKKVCSAIRSGRTSWRARRRPVSSPVG